MGVMECRRPRCTQIMCGLYIEDVGYVCYECQSEFKEYLEFKGTDKLSEGHMKRELKFFMSTQKDMYREGEEVDADEFFSSYQDEEY